MFDEMKSKELMDKYPDILKPHGWPGVGAGWLPILDDLCAKITALGGRLPKAVQIKEKFGGLRFYTDYGTDAQYQLIREAEHQAELTCESCGKPGTLRTDGWLKTYCDNCVNAD